VGGEIDCGKAIGSKGFAGLEILQRNKDLDQKEKGRIGGGGGNIFEERFTERVD